MQVIIAHYPHEYGGNKSQNANHGQLFCHIDVLDKSHYSSPLILYATTSLLDEEMVCMLSEVF